MNKGQVFLADLVASIAVFSIFVMAFGVMWNTSIEKFDESNRIDERGQNTFNLLKTQGYPHNWNKTNIEVPGFYTEGYLNKTKILKFENLTDKRKRQLLRTQEFMIKAEYMNGTLIEKEGSKIRVNSSPIPSDRSIYTYREITLTASDKKRTKLEYYRWDN